MRRTDLVRAARHTVDILGREDCLLVGGLAVGVHGYVRATRDVDFVTRLPLSEAKRRCGEAGMAMALRRGDVLEGDFPCLSGLVDGVRVDVLPPLVALDWDRAIDLRLSARAVLRVVDLDGLIQLKIRAAGPRDLLDVAALVLRHPEYRERALALAAARDLVAKLEIWLKDPRLERDMEQARREEHSAARARVPRDRARR